MNISAKNLKNQNTLKAAFLDRDGVINIDYGYVYLKKDFHLISGVFDALRYLQSLNYQIIIITNQSGIARGYYMEEDFKKISEYMINLLGGKGINIKDVFYCPHHPNGKIEKYRKECNCRKPKSGMIDAAILKYNIDRKKSILIGNSDSDLEAGKNSKIKSFLFNTENLYEFIIQNIKN